VTNKMNLPNGGSGWKYVVFNPQIQDTTIQVQTAEKEVEEWCVHIEKPLKDSIQKKYLRKKTLDSPIKVMIEKSQNAHSLYKQCLWENENRANMIVSDGSTSLDKLIEEHRFQWLKFKPKKWVLQQWLPGTNFFFSSAILTSYFCRPTKIPPPIRVWALKKGAKTPSIFSLFGCYIVNVQYIEPLSVDSIEGGIYLDQKRIVTPEKKIIAYITPHEEEGEFTENSLKWAIKNKNFDDEVDFSYNIEIWDEKASLEECVDESCQVFLSEIQRITSEGLKETGYSGDTE